MKSKLVNVLLIIAVFVLSSCAVPQQGQYSSNMMTDFASGVTASVDYVKGDDRTFITLDVDNPKGLGVDIWISQTYRTDDAETIKKRSLVKTSDKLVHQVIKAAKVDDSITEVIVFDIYDSKGEVLFSTEPIESETPWKEKEIVTSYMLFESMEIK